LGVELVFVVLFVVETRGRTLEETASLFDGEAKPDSLVQIAKEASFVDIRRLSTLDIEDDINCIYPERDSAFNKIYGIRAPELVLDKNQLGYAKGRGRVFSFTERI
jgi:hypothetical protein